MNKSISWLIILLIALGGGLGGLFSALYAGIGAGLGAMLGTVIYAVYTRKIPNYDNKYSLLRGEYNRFNKIGIVLNLIMFLLSIVILIKEQGLIYLISTLFFGSGFLYLILRNERS